MQAHTLSFVRQTMVDDGHAPMARLMDRIEKQPWADRLIYDQSMLRLFVAVPGASNPAMIVTYADGRGGGRPRIIDLDAFDVTCRETVTPGLTAIQVVEEIRQAFALPP